MNRIIPVFGRESGIFVILSIVNHVVATYQRYFAPVLAGVNLVRNIGGASRIPRF